MAPRQAWLQPSPVRRSTTTVAEAPAPLAKVARTSPFGDASNHDAGDTASPAQAEALARHSAAAKKPR